MTGILEQFDLTTILLIGLLSFVTSTIHGATGVAGGFLLSAALAPIIGVAPIVPVISVSLLISHSSRALLNIRDFDWHAFLAITITAVPCIIGFALLYGRMSSSLIALILAFVILISIPMRRWAKSREIKATKRTLKTVGIFYGSLSGVSIGPGMLLVPFLLGYGLTKEAFVATLAMIALLTNVTRVSVFGFGDLLNSEYIILGLMIGLVTIPGNWVGRTVLRRMTNDNHSSFVDVLTIIGAANFIWLAFR